MCGRCRVDKRPDCSYENVGSIERLAGRQRKRALRKQHTSDESVVSTSTVLATSEPTLKKGNSTAAKGKVIVKSEWSPSNLSIHPPLPLHRNHLQHSPSQDDQLVQDLYPASRHYHSIPFKMDMDNNSNSGHGRGRSSAPLSSHSSSTNHCGDEAIPSSYVTSFASSASSTGYPPIGGGGDGGLDTANDTFQNSSWISLSPTLPVQQTQSHLQHQHQQIPTTTSSTTPLNIIGGAIGLQNQPLHSFPSDYQSGHENDFASMDSLWRVYDWQYRCNNGLPSQYPLLSTGASSFPN